MSNDPAIAVAPTTTAVELMSGFPPPAPLQVDLSNWQQPQNVGWSFRHLREILPTQLISAGRIARPLPHSANSFSHPVVVRLNGTSSTVEEIFAETFTDAVLVLHDGVVMEERYAAGMTETTRHLMMSVSKSLVGCVAGVLAHQGLLDPLASVTQYVPELTISGYHEATVRDVLDMRTGVAFSETYTDPSAEVRLMERSMGWAPALVGDPPGVYAYLTTVGAQQPHGNGFVYRSADTDVLGWVCERAAGLRMADLISTMIWQPIGAEFDAEITCDSVGTAVHDGGVSATLRDLGRFGQALLDDGVVGGREVIPAAWLADTLDPPPDAREAFVHTENEAILPGGWYRNQFWFFRDGTAPIMLSLGIHGQLLYVDRLSRTVVAKLSSWPDAQNVTYLADTLRACGEIAATLAA